MPALHRSPAINKIKFISLFSFLPALVIGCYTMQHFGVPKNIWLANIVFTLVGMAIGLLLKRSLKFFALIGPKAIVFFLILFLLFTFYNEGSMNVHRWVSIAGVRLNVGLLVSPILLIQLSKLDNLLLPVLAFVVAAFIFLLQPDASQVAAFSIAGSILLISKTKNKVAVFCILFFALSITFISWHNLDNLPPISYVERIVQMAGKISKLFMFCSILSLVLIPLPLLVLYSPKNKIAAISLSVYFSLSILSTFLGNFPVLFMGYGISPIAGYLIASFWFWRS